MGSVDRNPLGSNGYPHNNVGAHRVRDDRVPADIAAVTALPKSQMVSGKAASDCGRGIEPI
jgi:hypothetical protein